MLQDLHDFFEEAMLSHPTADSDSEIMSCIDALVSISGSKKRDSV